MIIYICVYIFIEIIEYIRKIYYQYIYFWLFCNRRYFFFFDVDRYFKKMMYEKKKEVWQIFNKINNFREKGMSKFFVLLGVDQFRDVDRLRVSKFGSMV